METFFGVLKQKPLIGPSKWVFPTSPRPAPPQPGWPLRDLDTPAVEEKQLQKQRLLCRLRLKLQLLHCAPRSEFLTQWSSEKLEWDSRIKNWTKTQEEPNVYVSFMFVQKSQIVVAKSEKKMVALHSDVFLFFPIHRLLAVYVMLLLISHISLFYLFFT